MHEENNVSRNHAFHSYAVKLYSIHVNYYVNITAQDKIIAFYMFTAYCLIGKWFTRTFESRKRLNVSAGLTQWNNPSSPLCLRKIRAKDNLNFAVPYYTAQVDKKLVQQTILKTTEKSDVTKISQS